MWVYVSESQREGVVVLIPKPHKDPLLVVNHRSMSLINADYKIIFKVISNKIKPSLEKLIGKEQNGFMKGRCIGNNIRLLL